MPKNLKGISVTQRKALRAWYFAQRSRPSQKACIAWFIATYGHKLSQSTISESLSNQYKHLDSVNPSSLDSQRNRTARWIDLERCLYEWQLRIEYQGGLTTGDILCEKAREIWRSLPQYKDLPEPSFSIGWLDQFKKRWNIKQYNCHREAASVLQEAEAEMVTIRTLAGIYEEEDVYNMDETGLMWKMTPL